jgi:hypothetical protein
MTPALQLITDRQQRRTHTLFGSQSQHLKVATPADTTTVGEAQKSNVSSLPKPRFLRFIIAKRPNSISRVFEALSDKPNLASRSCNCAKNR